MTTGCYTAKSGNDLRNYLTIILTEYRASLDIRIYERLLLAISSDLRRRSRKYRFQRNKEAFTTTYYKAAIAFFDDMPVGFIFIEGKMVWTHVDPEYRRRGIATNLWNQMLDQFRTLKVRDAFISPPLDEQENSDVIGFFNSCNISVDVTMDIEKQVCLEF